MALAQFGILMSRAALRDRQHAHLMLRPIQAMLGVIAIVDRRASEGVIVVDFFGHFSTSY
jgi:hypothetical protein